MYPSASASSFNSVHPHIRGENGRSRSFKPWFCGSPPHTWGKCQIVEFFIVPQRFTPTYVGKIFFAWRTFSRFSVHPHIRGENEFSVTMPFFIYGSPPHTWGKYSPFSGLVTGWRFTPTYVGKIQGLGVALTLYTVHPHIRGENLIDSRK